MPALRTPSAPDAVIDLPGHRRPRWKWLEAGLAAVLAIQAVRLLWAVFVPVAVPGSPSLPTAQVAPMKLSGHDPFQRDGAAGATGALNGWTLFGLRTASGTDPGSAILAREGKPQASYRVGDEVATGVVLKAVSPEHALLDRGGVEERIAFDTSSRPASPRARAALPSAAPAAAQVATTPSETIAAADIDPARLLATTGLQAQREGGRVTGYRVVPRGDDALLRRAGLRAGDVLVDVNGRALDPERLPELAAELRSNPSARVTFRRDGQVHTIDIGGEKP